MRNVEINLAGIKNLDEFHHYELLAGFYQSKNISSYSL